MQTNKQTRNKLKQIQFPQRILSRNLFGGCTSPTFSPSKFILTELLYLVYIIKGPMK